MIFRYAIALLGIALATGLRRLLDPVLGNAFPFATLFLAILVAAWYGGFGPGVSATLFGAIASVWFLLVPDERPHLHGFEPHAGLALFMAVGLGIAALGGAMQTARQRAEAEASAAVLQREELTDFFENATLGMHWIGEEGTILGVNRAELELLGYTDQEFVGKNIADFHVDEGTIVDMFRRLRTGENLRHYPARLRCKDGSIKEVLIESSVMWQEGRFVHSRCFMRDVTEQVSAERALRESEAKLRLLADTIPQLAWMAHPDGHIYWYNRRWHEYTGTTAEQMEGWGWQTVHDPNTLPSVLRRWTDSIASGEPFDMVFPLRGADGVFRPFLTRVNPLRDGESRIIHWFGTNTDISEQKRAEENAHFLARASATLAGLVDYESTLQKVAHLAVPVFADWCTVDMLSEDGTLRRVAVSHVQPDKVQLAHELHRRFPPDPTAPQGVWNVLRSGESEFVAEIVDDLLVTLANDADLLAILRELGLKSYMAVPLSVRGKVLGVITFIAAESGRRYNIDDLAVTEDLAQRAAVAIDNARLYQEVREANRRKDEFLAVLGHELRNPLAPISNALYVLKRRKGDADIVEQAREIMERQVHHMVRLVDDLLDVSRIVRGKVELRRDPVDLAAVISRAVETSQPLIDAEGHELTVLLPPEPLLVVGDLVRLAQAVSNLLNNAARYTERGGKIQVEGRREGGKAILRVRDTGIGIAAEMLPQIWEIFVQAERRTKSSQGGMGVGLALVKGLVELHGGTVEAYSEGLGKGSDFTIRLPLMLSKPHGQSCARVVAAPVESRRVLVVDDNVDAAESLAMLLRLEGHKVRVAYDGPSALTLATIEAPELAFFDIGMPEMDGLELARRFRADPVLNEVRLIALTGWGMADDRRRTKEAGFDAHEVKPVGPEALSKLFGQHE